MTADGGIDADALGRATWTFLHTLAASQPEHLSECRQQRLRRFIADFSHVYPCTPCADSFRDILATLPPDTTSGPRFARWMCAAHNAVNAELGKQAFDCKRVGQRWGVCEQCTAHQDELDQFKAMLGNSKKLYIDPKASKPN